MQYVKWLLDLVYFYRSDKAHGKPYWTDPACIGLAVSIVCALVVHIAGLQVSAGTQASICSAIVGVGVALSPHTGVKKVEQGAGSTTHKALQSDSGGLQSNLSGKQEDTQMGATGL